MAVSIFTTLLEVPLMQPLRLVFLLLISTAGWCVYNLFFHPLSRFPGPLSARLGLPLWRIRHSLDGTYAFALHDLHLRHGPVVRIGPTHLSFSNPAALASIYSASNGISSKFVKSGFYKSFQVLKDAPSIFSERNPERHAKRKRAVAPAYSIPALEQLEEYVEVAVETFLERFGNEVERGGKQSKDGKGVSVKLDRWFSCLAMDVIGEIAFGKSFGLLHGDLEDPSMTRFLGGVLNLSQWGAVAGCVPFLSPLILYLFPRLTGQAGGEVIGTVTRSRIEQRYAEVEAGTASVRPDMLSKFMEARHPDTRQQYSQRDVLFTATSVISAGADTTSTALSIFLGYVTAHPACYERVRREVDEAVASGAISSPVKYKEAVRLEYVQACIKESLRLHPPISMDLPRYVPAGGAVIAGCAIPGGTTVGVSPYVVHRHPDAYGSDAHLFRPERWIEADEEQRRKMERYNFTFGGGSRTCIGKNISLMEVSKIVPELITRFEFEICQPQADVANDDQEKRQLPFQTKSAWFLEAKNLVLRVTRRS